MEPYASNSNFTAVYSIKGVSSAELTNAWMPYGMNRVNEALGGFYTLPFSSNNMTARDLNVDFAYLGILVRTRKPDDSKELDKQLDKRIGYLTSSGSPMMMDDGTPVYPDRNNIFSVYSSTKDHKNVFDMREAPDQRIDPDQLQTDWNEDIS